MKIYTNVRTKNLRKDSILFMINGIEEISRETIKLILRMKELMLDYKHRL